MPGEHKRRNHAKKAEEAPRNNCKRLEGIPERQACDHGLWQQVLYTSAVQYDDNSL
jgi:hypothetical protein